MASKYPSVRNLLSFGFLSMGLLLAVGSSCGLIDPKFVRYSDPEAAQGQLTAQCQAGQLTAEEAFAQALGAGISSSNCSTSGCHGPSGQPIAGQQVGENSDLASFRTALIAWINGAGSGDPALLFNKLVGQNGFGHSGAGAVQGNITRNQIVDWFGCEG